MAFNVFISYSSKDLLFVDQVKFFLQNQNIEVYVAEYSLMPGLGISSNIREQIINCDLFILIWSENAKYSEWVGQEIGIATGQNIAILPVVLDSNLELPGFIKDIKYLDASYELHSAINHIHNIVSKKAQDKAKKNNFVFFAIGGTLLYLLSKND